MSAPQTIPGKQSDWPVHAMRVVLWAALLLQLWLSLQLAHHNGKSLLHGFVIYFGYFTILTNLLVALILSFTVSSGGGLLRKVFTHPQVMACAATSILLVGLGYHFLLRNIWNPQGLQWLADFALHYITPLGFCTIWLFRMPKQFLPWWSPLAWPLYPIIYLIYALARGAFLGSYPYPFIDVTEIGRTAALRNAAGLLIVFVATGYLLLAVKMRFGRPGQPTIIKGDLLRTENRNDEG